MLDLRSWLRKAEEQKVQEAAEAVAEAAPAIKVDDHEKMVTLNEIRDAVEGAFREQAKGDIDWWDVANILASLTDDLLDQVEDDVESEV